MNRRDNESEQYFYISARKKPGIPIRLERRRNYPCCVCTELGKKLITYTDFYTAEAIHICTDCLDNGLNLLKETEK